MSIYEPYLICLICNLVITVGLLGNGCVVFLCGYFPHIRDTNDGLGRVILFGKVLIGQQPKPTVCE